MTLTVRAKPPAHHKKHSGRHHKRTKEYHKPYWPYLPMLLIVLGSLFLNMGVSAHRAVLAYATDMSIQGLLDGTNTQRTSNGLAALGLNAKLDQAAQAKANDMVARDYWSHNTPDGQTPWTFMTAAGYNYQTAGENLAYGFDSSSDTVTGWMNSPGHRANILNSSYKEVGFGIANSSNFQNNGPQTVVVAMYASPVGAVEPTPVPSPPAPAPAPAPAPTPPPASTNKVSPAPAPSPTPTPPPAATPTAGGSSQASGGAPPASTTPSTPTATEPNDAVTTTTPLKSIEENDPQKITRLEVLTAGNVAWSGAAASLLIVSGIAIFFFRHGLAWHRFLNKGEKFVLTHPIFDIMLTMFIMAAIYLSLGIGTIR